MPQVSPNALLWACFPRNWTICFQSGTQKLLKMHLHRLTLRHVVGYLLDWMHYKRKNSWNEAWCRKLGTWIFHLPWVVPDMLSALFGKKEREFSHTNFLKVALERKSNRVSMQSGCITSEGEWKKTQNIWCHWDRRGAVLQVGATFLRGRHALDLSMWQ